MVFLLRNDNTDDPALQYLVNSEKEHHAQVVANLIDVLKGYVDKFHELLLIEPIPPIAYTTTSNTVTVDSGISNETIVVSTTESTPEKVDEVKEKPTVAEVEEDATENSSEESSAASSSAEVSSPEREPEKPVEAETKAEEELVSTRRNNNFSGTKAFGNTRLQVCCLFTVLLETEHRDIITA